MPFLDLEGLQILWSNILSKLSNKVDHVEGKQLSTNDFTNEEKSKLASLAQSNWAASENEPGYVLNRTHYDAVMTKTLFNGTITATAGTLTRINNIPDEMIINYPDVSVVKATFDGKNCTITASTNKWEFRDPNGQLVFTMNYDTAKGAQCLVSTYAGSGAHTLIIEADEITAVPLDEKYIPNTIPRRVDIPHMAMPDWGAAEGEAGYVKNRTHYEEKGIIVPNTITNVPSSDLYTALPVLNEALVVGNTYVIGLDNENYTCVAWQEGEVIYLGNGTIYPGVAKGEDVPFSIDTYPDGTAYLNTQTGGEYVISIGTPGTVKQLDEKFIPDSIARVNDIPTIPTPDWNAKESEAGYIENKPFGYGPDYFEYEFNGNVEDYECIMDPDGEVIGVKIGEAWEEDFIENLKHKQLVAKAESEGNIIQFPVVLYYTDGLWAIMSPRYGIVGINCLEETVLSGIITIPKGLFLFSGESAFDLSQLRSLICLDIKTIDKEFLPNISGDWDENDPSSLSYIQNRTHYESFKKYEFNGNYEDYEHVILSSNPSTDTIQGYVKISNDVPDINDFNGGKIVMHYLGEDLTESFTNELIEPIQDNVYLFNDIGIMVTDGVFEVEENIILNKGFWVRYYQQSSLKMYLSKINFSTGIHRLDEKFIPNTIARAESVKAVANDLTTLSNSLAPVATSGDYNDLTNKPTIPSIEGLATEKYVTDTVAETEQWVVNTFATPGYVNTAIANMVDSAPETLNTLNELAAALGDDPNFATTVATQIGNIESTKVDKVEGKDLSSNDYTDEEKELLAIIASDYLTSEDKTEINTKLDVAYIHAENKGKQYASGLYKLATNTEGHVTSAVAVTKEDIVAFGIPAQDTTYKAISNDEIDEICGMNIISSDDDYIDETTGARYRLYVDNGNLHMTEVE